MIESYENRNPYLRVALIYHKNIWAMVRGVVWGWVMNLLRLYKENGMSGRVTVK